MWCPAVHELPGWDVGARKTSHCSELHWMWHGAILDYAWRIGHRRLHRVHIREILKRHAGWSGENRGLFVSPLENARFCTAVSTGTRRGLAGARCTGWYRIEGVHDHRIPDRIQSLHCRTWKTRMKTHWKARCQTGKARLPSRFRLPPRHRPLFRPRARLAP